MNDADFVPLDQALRALETCLARHRDYVFACVRAHDYTRAHALVDSSDAMERAIEDLKEIYKTRQLTLAEIREKTEGFRFHELIDLEARKDIWDHLEAEDTCQALSAQTT